MKLTINATPKELAALISNLQEQPKFDYETLMKRIHKAERAAGGIDPSVSPRK